MGEVVPFPESPAEIERKRFEHWAREGMAGPLQPGNLLSRTIGGKYLFPAVKAAWAAWRARPLIDTDDKYPRAWTIEAERKRFERWIHAEVITDPHECAALLARNRHGAYELASTSAAFASWLARGINDGQRCDA